MKNRELCLFMYAPIQNYYRLDFDLEQITCEFVLIPKFKISSAAPGFLCNKTSKTDFPIGSSSFFPFSALKEELRFFLNSGDCLQHISCNLDIQLSRCSSARGLIWGSPCYVMLRWRLVRLLCVLKSFWVELFLNNYDVIEESYKLC